jgi:cation-transporting P-type ATPase C
LRRLLLGSGVLAGPPGLTAVVGVCTIVTGWPFLKGAWRTLVGRRRLTTDTLVS